MTIHDENLLTRLGKNPETSKSIGDGTEPHSFEFRGKIPEKVTILRALLPTWPYFCGWLPE